ncbi:MAG: hypothetical protein LBQ54_00655, partial [Planctomycetaceae bacterium]|nr:hypothetical protein [Planctomycetaceae bacterium]
RPTQGRWIPAASRGGRFASRHFRAVGIGCKNLSNWRPKATAVKQYASLRRAAVGRCTPDGTAVPNNDPLLLVAGINRWKNDFNMRPKVYSLSPKAYSGRPNAYVFLPIDTSEQHERVIVSGRESHPGCNVRTLLVDGVNRRNNVFIGHPVGKIFHLMVNRT